VQEENPRFFIEEKEYFVAKNTTSSPSTTQTMSTPSFSSTSRLV